jgi:hypothetical protein
MRFQAASSSDRNPGNSQSAIVNRALTTRCTIAVIC